MFHMSIHKTYFVKRKIEVLEILAKDVNPGGSMSCFVFIFNLNSCILLLKLQYLKIDTLTSFLHGQRGYKLRLDMIKDKVKLKLNLDYCFHVDIDHTWGVYPYKTFLTNLKRFIKLILNLSMICHYFKITFILIFLSNSI